MKQMRKQARRLVTLLACALFLGVCSSATAAKMLNGYYEADNGGAYFVRQIGDSVYWFGEDPNGAWANVLVGTISGNKITARFWDVPKGKTQGMGEMILQIQNDDSLVKLSSTTPFGTKSWKKTVIHMEMVNGVGVLKGMPPEMRSRPQGYSGGEQNLTGAWQGDDAAFYYVRETPTDIVWVAENNQWGGPGGNAQPSFTHVFFGKKGDNSISGHWIDIPKGKAAGSGTLTVTIKGPQDMATIAKTGGFTASAIWRSLPNSLRGYADLHTHPMVNLGFGGKLIHGGVDVGSLLPADSDCNHNVRAKSINQALGNDKSTHGGFGAFDNPCGDSLRAAFIDLFQTLNKAIETPDNSVGYPSFANYPKWNDISHQKMWVDWIRRSYDSGQRVLVALATHNSTLAAVASGPGDGPNDDATSADLQIKEMKALVARHSDFMEVAFSPADLRRIIAANKMAVVIGIEIDNIGNFNKLMLNPVPTPLITNEIKRLHDEGVRYIFPVHVLDNAFGHTAVYEDLFNYSNKREEGHFWELQCADPDEQIDYKFKPILGDDVPSKAKEMLGALAKMVKVSLDLKAPKSPVCVDPKNPSNKNIGHKNIWGLNAEGRFAIKEMMKLGMLVDVDHMSEKGVYNTLDEAEKIPGGYPLVSGHTNIRPYQGNENSRTSDQLERIGKLGGMFGLGSDGVPANFWAARYAIADDWIRGDKSKGPILSEGRVAFGTDLNGLVKGPPPRAGANIYKDGFSPSMTGDKTWDYRNDGVAHYGMLADFREDIRTVPVYGERVYSSMLKNAEMFAQMWEKAVKNSKNVPR